MRNETQSKHTLGPWKSGDFIKSGVGGLNIFSERNGEVVARACNLAPEMEANANLIAAAPDLLEACNAIAGYYDLIKQNYPDLPGLIKGISLARAAIAKATGGGK